MKINFSIIVILILFLHVSCEKVINISLNDSESQIVIEGKVTNQSSTQTVKISRSVPLGDPNIFPGVSGALVTITDYTGKVFTLTEQSAGVYVITGLRGQFLRTYKLKVVSNGREYIAESTMPSQVSLDFLKLTETNFLNREMKFVEVFYIDSPHSTNYYRFILSVNNTPSKNIFIFTDELDRGIVSRSLKDFDLSIVSGDVIDVEMQCIDKNLYHYWDGLDKNRNRGGASTTPANPVSNISNQALGYFSAHTSHHKVLIIP